MAGRKAVDNLFVGGFPAALERTSFRPILIPGVMRAVMIRYKIAEVQTTMSDEEVALCQRVYDHVRLARHVTRDGDLNELGRRIIQSFQHGVRDENALTRLVI